MLEDEEVLSSSFFETSPFGAEPPLESEVSDAQAFSFKPDLSLNINSINNPWDPPSLGADISSILCIPLILLYC
jgi:hypothetical protein